jgi:diguanylate cyclase (GGDEF)-like protein/PAS domain S-box-containing protein
MADSPVRQGPAKKPPTKNEERYALALEGAGDGLWDWDLEQDKLYLSPRWKKLLGYKEDEVDDSPFEWRNRIHPDDLHRVRADIDAHLKGTTPRFQNEHRMLHKDGNHRWVLTRGVAVRDSEGRPQRMVGTMTDITQRKLVEEQILHDALHDALTGLPNRALFLDRLGIAIAHAKRRKDHIYSVLFVDLDQFKTINDSLGHVIGDKVLVAIARRMGSALRPGDTVARLGGDEFAVLVDGLADQDAASLVADRLITELSSPFEVDGHDILVSASIGITSSHPTYESPEDVLRDADRALYRAKSVGTARREIFEGDAASRLGVSVQLENDLRLAIEHDELRLHYQPIVTLDSGSIVGFEALLRWSHPQRGLMYPVEFVPLADQSGLIVPIGRWVLKEACRQMASWQTQFPERRPLSVGVNLSGRQFLQFDLVEQIEASLAATKLEAGSLRLEIPETILMENSEAAIEKLCQLRDLKVELNIDDFGTGYSSLSLLHRLPTDSLKIDRSFVGQIGVHDRSAQIVATIVTLARNLGMTVAAEGLETAHQVQAVRGLECEYGQGYFFSKPVDGDSAESLLSSPPSW